MQKLVACGLLAFFSVSAFAENMYIYKEDRVPVMLSDVQPSESFNKYSEKVEVAYFSTSGAKLYTSSNSSDSTSFSNPYVKRVTVKSSSNPKISENREVTKDMYLYQDDQGLDHLSSVRPTDTSKSVEKVRVSYTRLNPPSENSTNPNSIESLPNSAQQKTDELSDLVRRLSAQ